MEKLTLSLCVQGRASFIDGNYLANEILSHMLHLQTFHFDIVTQYITINEEPRPCSDSIRRTFTEAGRDTDCYVDYYLNGTGRCHVYSLPFTLERIRHISHSFPGGMFINVRILRVFDMYPFENAFFARIALAFPLLNHLTISNAIKQKKKSSHQLENSEEESSIIEYPHLIELVFSCVHIDYVEQFLSSLNTRLPCLSKLHVQYEQLVTVTESFTRNATRINCAKLKHITFHEDVNLEHSKDFYIYFPLL
ncbi:unnamed protein product [Rotaria sp. Silwood2]|nr:unnamed protein product [Rotaria sp. Silwood2]CAF4597041.1 unnamed protein product [Rotaria sp. Silwood2]